MAGTVKGSSSEENKCAENREGPLVGKWEVWLQRALVDRLLGRKQVSNKGKCQEKHKCQGGHDVPSPVLQLEWLTVAEGSHLKGGVRMGRGEVTLDQTLEGMSVSLLLL